MLATYLELMHSNEPAHSWEIAMMTEVTDGRTAATPAAWIGDSDDRGRLLGRSRRAGRHCAGHRRGEAARLPLIVVHTSPATEVAELAAELAVVGGAVRGAATADNLDPAEELIAAADESDAEFIVIGLRRRSPVGKLLLGSNAQRVLLDAACPVLAVKAEEH